MSLYRLPKPLQRNAASPVIAANLVVIAAASGFTSVDPHFMTDIMHVLELRKNAAFAFLVSGIRAGIFVMEGVYFLL